MSETLYIKEPDAIFTEPGPGQVVLLQLETGQYHTLNASGVVLWDALAASCSESGLAKRLMEEFDVDAETAAADANQFISEMLDRKLIKPA